MNAFFQVDTCRRTAQSSSRALESWGLAGWHIDHHCLELCTTTRSSWGVRSVALDDVAALHLLGRDVQSLKLMHVKELQWHTDIHLRYYNIIYYPFSDISQRSGFESRVDVKNQFLYVSTIRSICKMPETFSDAKRRRGLLAGWGSGWDVYKIVCLHVLLSLCLSFFDCFSVYVLKIMGLSSTTISQLMMCRHDCEKMLNERTLQHLKQPIVILTPTIHNHPKRASHPRVGALIMVFLVLLVVSGKPQCGECHVRRMRWIYSKVWSHGPRMCLGRR